MFQYISCCSLSVTDYQNTPVGVLFQYISCCSLSLGIAYNFRFHLRFNTSHVVVYLNLTGSFVSWGKFQYISCCSLSVSHFLLHKRYQLFQYISCCSLSFPYISFCRRKFRFNTSHVVVYPKATYPAKSDTAVSIHLML